MDIILVPPLAFLIYMAILWLLRWLPARAVRESELYAGGEVHPGGNASPGYQSYFVMALFFAVLHLGALVLASGVSSPVMFVYLFGLVLALLALMLG